MPETPSPPPPLTPMLSQYLDIKRRYPDAILFYRMGDFYEMFFEDAKTAAPLLEVQLTSRDKNATNPIPMCGVPHHAAMAYLQKLLAKGYKVALCEQMEDPSTAKGLVRREVTRVFTPALIGDPELVPPDACHWLLALAGPAQGPWQASLLDLLSGERRNGTLDDAQALLELFREFRPKEVLVGTSPTGSGPLPEALRLFPETTVTLRENYFTLPEPVAQHAIEHYLKETQRVEELPFLAKPAPLFTDETMRLDPTTLAALEILPDKMRAATLSDVLDVALTPMGRRQLRVWLARPLSHLRKIRERHAAVEALLSDLKKREQLKEWLSGLRDLERLTTKTGLGLAMPRDLLAIRSALQLLPSIAACLGKCRARLLVRMGESLEPLTALCDKLMAALQDDLPATFREGDVFRDTYHEDVALYRGLSRRAKETIAQMEAQERERTGIPSLKFRYSRVFGYTIEVTKAHLAKVPSDYVRKQTIVNGERYITAQLKELEEKILTAEHRLRALEESLFLELRQEVAKHSLPLLKNARLIADLDVLLAFATQAAARGYRRPEMHEGRALSIESGRHPVVETLLPRGKFVPNSVALSPDDCRTLLITGPNMAGKSTVMRQVALLCVMAQAGSFVPAERAVLPVLDAIYTRIGSADDIGRGQSTFMVEMSEVARILAQATSHSLVVIDEIGRGTSTYDGLSLAWAIVEYLHEEIRPLTLFATHFHELTQLEKSQPGLKNANVLVKRWKDGIVFLHQLAPGSCPQSYGIEVARLAALPPKVLTRAKNLLGVLESQSQKAGRARNRALEGKTNQMLIFDELGKPENPASHVP